MGIKKVSRVSLDRMVYENFNTQDYKPPKKKVEDIFKPMLDKEIEKVKKEGLKIHLDPDGVWRDNV